MNPNPTHTPAPTPTPNLKMIDLFAGTGAFSKAFINTGRVDVVFANDVLPISKQIYDANFNHSLTLGDLHDIDVTQIPKHDILTGGFPCQPFSIAGKQQGFDDTRSNVFWKIVSIVEYHQPEYIILENVKNLLSHDKGNTFNIIKSSFEKLHYNVCYKIFDTAKISGIPQHRERIYIICMKNKESFDKFSISISMDFGNVEKRPLVEFLEKNKVDEKYYYNDKSKIWHLLENDVKHKNTVYQFRRVYVRENKSGVCPTLTANMGSGGHNVPIILDDFGIRKLTPRECFNLQGFPSSTILPKMSDCNLYKLAGNAVSLPVIEKIAQCIVNLL